MKRPNFKKSSYIKLIFFILIILGGYNLYKSRSLIISKFYAFDFPKKINLINRAYARSKATSSKFDLNKQLITSYWHDINKDLISTKGFSYNYMKNPTIGLPGGYIDYLNENTLLGMNGKGEMFSYFVKENNLVKVPSNMNKIFNNQKFKGKLIPNLRGRFGVRDIFIDRIDKKIYSSIFVDTTGKGCYGLGIFSASLENKFNSSDNNFQNLEFKEFFKTKVCNSNFNGHASGGRIKKLEDKIIFTVGTLDFEAGMNTDLPELQGKIPEYLILEKRNNAVGKVIAIDNKGNYSILSSGHRNAQGLSIVNNEIFVTEHGPKGGDEINLVLNKSHYGWPYYSYGTGYDDKTYYRLEHEGKYKKPIYYFTPSIGISELLFYDGNEFPYWKNKFLVSSLKANSIYILDYDFKNKSMISSEKLDIGHRIRDIAVGSDGKITIMTDDQNLVILSNANLEKLKKTNFKFPLPE